MGTEENRLARNEAYDKLVDNRLMEATADSRYNFQSSTWKLIKRLVQLSWIRRDERGPSNDESDQLMFKLYEAKPNHEKLWTPVWTDSWRDLKMFALEWPPKTRSYHLLPMLTLLFIPLKTKTIFKKQAWKDPWMESWVKVLATLTLKVTRGPNVFFRLETNSLQKGGLKVARLE